MHQNFPSSQDILRDSKNEKSNLTNCNMLFKAGLKSKTDLG